MDHEIVPFDISKWNKSIKSFGWLKTIAVYLLFYLVPNMGIQIYTNNKLNDKINTVINNQHTQIVQVGPNNTLGTYAEDKQSKEIVLVSNSTSSFNPEDWLIENFYQDGDGYYCPNVSNFDYWSMWTKKEFPLKVEKINIRILIKPSLKKKNPPTIAISYGSFSKNFAPKQFYRLNIFDSDTKTIRLYDEKNKSNAQDWLKDEPDLNSEMIVTLSPRIPDPNRRKLNVNPTIKYAINNSDKEGGFISNESFEVTLPTVAVEDGTVSKQFGIGTQKGNCFKIIAFDFEI